eukprot:TRINITY_DN388_c0_g1_i7.p1 TRINITY_DN388_c0_g1~~TRINITY_DN388_c0_g1_i7.p1  ORF type:complete len:827 (+),score=176.23 TRINITY_DN388_c0_g1_i7:169-2649(+)
MVETGAAPGTLPPLQPLQPRTSRAHVVGGAGNVPRLSRSATSQLPLLPSHVRRAHEAGPAHRGRMRTGSACTTTHSPMAPQLPPEPPPSSALATEATSTTAAATATVLESPRQHNLPRVLSPRLKSPRTPLALTSIASAAPPTAATTQAAPGTAAQAAAATAAAAAVATAEPASSITTPSLPATEPSSVSLAAIASPQPPPQSPPPLVDQPAPALTASRTSVVPLVVVSCAQVATAQDAALVASPMSDARAAIELLLEEAPHIRTLADVLSRACLVRRMQDTFRYYDQFDASDHAPVSDMATQLLAVEAKYAGRFAVLAGAYVVCCVQQADTLAADVSSALGPRSVPAVAVQTLQRLTDSMRLLLVRVYELGDLFQQCMTLSGVVMGALPKLWDIDKKIHRTLHPVSYQLMAQIRVELSTAVRAEDVIALLVMMHTFHTYICRQLAQTVDMQQTCGSLQFAAPTLLHLVARARGGASFANIAPGISEAELRRLLEQLVVSENGFLDALRSQLLERAPAFAGQLERAGVAAPSAAAAAAVSPGDATGDAELELALAEVRPQMELCPSTWIVNYMLAFFFHGGKQWRGFSVTRTSHAEQLCKAIEDYGAVFSWCQKKQYLCAPFFYSTRGVILSLGLAKRHAVTSTLLRTPQTKHSHKLMVVTELASWVLSVVQKGWEPWACGEFVTQLRIAAADAVAAGKMACQFLPNTCSIGQLCAVYDCAFELSEVFEFLQSSSSACEPVSRAVGGCMRDVLDLLRLVTKTSRTYTTALVSRMLASPSSPYALRKCVQLCERATEWRGNESFDVLHPRILSGWTARCNQRASRSS